MLLYNSSISGNCYKVRLLLAHLGVDYERRDVDVIDRSDRREFLGDLNPARRVPTVVLDDGRALAESNAILWYFGEGTRFVPGDRYERAKVLQWMFFEQYEHEPAIAVARFLKTYYGQPDVWESQREQLTKHGIKALRMLEDGLQDRDWLAGGAMTIADIALYAYTHAAGEGGFSLDEQPAIRAWLDRVAAQPGHVTMAD
ncbi:MAG TPA: glutathione S-transferase family protein [Gaiellaceae bacterium]